MTHRPLILAAALTLGLAPAVAAESLRWIPAAAHVDGANATVWRTDVTVLNPCDQEAAVTLQLRIDGQVVEESFTIAAGRQQVFADVVSLLGAGDGTGALLVRADRPVVVASRTFNDAADGTFGQGLPGVDPASTPAAGEEVVLTGLREGSGFRTNIALLNTADGPVTAEVTLRDGLGATVGSFSRQLQPGARVQVNRPYAEIFGREDILAGHARVVATGDGLWSSASVVDDASGDPTTVLPAPVSVCPVDLADRLGAIPGLRVEERSTAQSGYRYFELHYDQPADHSQPAGERFEQYMTLLVRDPEAPMILMTKGYGNSQRDRRSELATMLEANQIAVEHRFFASSTPSSRDWDLLDIEQAAADHHRVVAALEPLFPGVWISTGHSKGGMTATYHRHLWPDDVDATVAYVAPLSFGRDDPRYVTFLETVGDAACRNRLRALQREALGRRDEMLARLGAAAGGRSYDRIGGLEAAFETVVMELPFSFWQYFGAGFCQVLPEPATVSDSDLFTVFDTYVGFGFPTDATFGFYDPYFFQAHHQLGYPAVAVDHLDDLLEVFPPSLEEGVVPEGTDPVFDSAAMLGVSAWLDGEGERMLFVYGENDPWSAGAYELGDAVDSYVFVDPSGNHGARIGTLSGADQSEVVSILARWTGMAPTAAPAVMPPDSDVVVGRPVALERSTEQAGAREGR